MIAENGMIRVNPLPAPTWRWLRINDTELQLPEDVTEALVETELPADASEETGSLQASADASGADEMPAVSADASETGMQTFTEEEYDRIREMETGMGRDFADYMMTAPVDPFLWKAGEAEKTEEPLVFRIFNTGLESSANRFFFSAEKDSEFTVVQYLSKDDARDMTESGDAPVYSFVDTRVLVAEGAKVHLIQIADSAPEMCSCFDVGACVAEGGSFDILQIGMDGRSSFFGAAADLAGANAHFAVETAYRVGAGQHVDMNYVARHRGVNTECEMDIKGVLTDGASKSCRATIDFIRGCKGAKGDEREDVLLLGEDIVNKTIPLILCQEEDVEGAHGATIGDLSEEILGYFRSRGIDDELAYRLMATGRLLGSIEKVPVKSLRDVLMTELGEEIEDE